MATRRTLFRDLPETATEFVVGSSMVSGAGSAFTLIAGGGQTAQFDFPAKFIGVVDGLVLMGVPAAGIPVVFFSVRRGTGGAIRVPGYEEIALPGIDASARTLEFDTDIVVNESDLLSVFARNSDAVAHNVAAYMHGFLWPK